MLATVRDGDELVPGERTAHGQGVSRHWLGRLAPGRLKLLAVVSGVLAAALSLAVPFLPVHHDITTLKWPTAHGTKPISAPLSGYSPIRLDFDVPCRTALALDARHPGPATLVATNSPSSHYGALTGMTLQVHEGQLSLLSRGRQLGSTPIAGDCSIAVRSDGRATTAEAGGKPFAQADGDARPQLTGVYSDLDARADDVREVSFRAEVDNRYQSHATPLKTAAIALAVLAFLGSLLALRGIDARAARRPRRLTAAAWWRPTARDAAVAGALVVWWLIGAMTADDGYFLTMARAREDLGYVSDFYRWFVVAVAPMGWFIDVYSPWVHVSTSTPWVRLPALVMGVASWLLISRQVLPRLGRQVRTSSAAGWAAAAVFLAFWMPYNGGLRPEPVVVLFSLLVLCLVERAVATGRLLPAALGLTCAALSVGVNPHGVVAVLPFVAAFKPLTNLLARRAATFGWAPVLSPVVACGLVVLTLMFGDQTLGSAADATKVRGDLGPSLKWFQELARYDLLFSPTVDGSLTRRFPVLLVLLCLATCLVVLLRRGRIRGAALGPSRRLLAVAALSFVALALTPTKHTHHFGVFAAVGGALAALTALATSTTVLRSRRNRAVFFAGLMLILAFAATGPNAWFYVSGWGVPWYDKPPSVGGYRLSTLLLVAAGIALVVAFAEHMRIDQHRPEVVLEKRSRALRLGTAPLSVICALLMVGEIATFGKVIQEQGGGYSLGMDNIRQLTGSSCGLSDYVYVETNPRAGLLTVSADQPTVATPGTRVPGHDPDRETPDHYLRAAMHGFGRDGLPFGDGTEPGEPDWRPPAAFGDDRAPVWGSYEPTGTGTGELRTQWYDVPDRAAGGEVPIVLALGGRELGANSVHIEFGRETGSGFELMQRYPVAQPPAPRWRDHRVTVGGPSRGATKMRVVARDQALGPDGWLAVSAPRAPQLIRMTDVVGDAPAFVEWPAALLHPCLRTARVRDGIAELPRFRVSAGGELRGVGQGWSSPDAGGPFGWLNVAASVRELPTYLRNDIRRDWGSLYAVDPYTPEALPAQTAMDVRTETHWGRWSPGPLPRTLRLPGDVPDSRDRTDVPRFEETVDQQVSAGAP
ncbi:arabinosyltransferase domain-containing protein [Saccharopolyspora erythraea]|uniref:arabinosyltransferase domain-containing protein n=1 Tax=Saccharopolyspora erythraea TaxID=1836 RepID=UPI00038D0F0C|nr:arabinosyltransferase domain-containing protein [Saccharopolyspora erythraea]EQD85267.1 arabinosyltransferase [Saccharopolyspora erythraea D]QRK88197.1 arabinosyltransferase domain-containing protein [Saccharopolyspora erythraea]